MQAHPEDMLGDTCALCARGDEQATDWVCCDRCGSWRHFSCDTRPGLGAFKVRPWCAMLALSYIGMGSASETAGCLHAPWGALQQLQLLAAPSLHYMPQPWHPGGAPWFCKQTLQINHAAYEEGALSAVGVLRLQWCER